MTMLLQDSREHFAALKTWCWLVKGICFFYVLTTFVSDIRCPRENE